MGANRGANILYYKTVRGLERRSEACGRRRQRQEEQKRDKTGVHWAGVDPFPSDKRLMKTFPRLLPYSTRNSPFRHTAALPHGR